MKGVCTLTLVCTCPARRATPPACLLVVNRSSSTATTAKAKRLDTNVPLWSSGRTTEFGLPFHTPTFSPTSLRVSRESLDPRHGKLLNESGLGLCARAPAPNLCAQHCSVQWYTMSKP